MQAYYTSAQQMSPFTPLVPPKIIPGGIGSINYSIYASPDAAAGRGPNNTRVLGDVNPGQANQQRQFVILVQWNVPAIRFAANILRMYDLVTRVVMVPANRVVILYNNPTPAALGPIIGPIVDDPNGLLPPAMAGGPLGTNSRLARCCRPTAVSPATYVGPVLPVTIGNIGPGSTVSQEPVEHENDIFGSTVQLAARLCFHAEPDQIRVSNVVAELCMGKGLTFRPLGEVSLKGFGQPVRIHAVEC
jgi:hypothetical protein